MERFRFTPSRVASWAERYGIDFTGLVLSAEEHDDLVHVNSYDTRHWRRLAPPVLVGDFDLLRFELGTLERQVPFRTTAAGSISGVLLFFEAELGAGVDLSLHPDEATPSNSWGNVLYLPARPVDVAEGDDVLLQYDYSRGSRIRLTHER